jgi:Glucose dehydrogenase C-terminus
VHQVGRLIHVGPPSLQTLRISFPEVIQPARHVHALAAARRRAWRVSSAGVAATVDPGLLNRNMVLRNSVLFGSVNANRHHYELAARALAQADPGWLAGLITRQAPLQRWTGAYTREPDDIKTVLSFFPPVRTASPARPG